MKEKIITTLLFVLFASSLHAVNFNLNDRFKARAYQRNSHDVLFGKKVFRNKKAFRELVNNLGKEKKKRVLKLIKEFDSIIPERILIPFVYWRVVRNSSVKASQVLTYYMMDKIFILRDYADDPVFEKSIESLGLLRSITRLPKLETDKIMQNVFPLFVEKGRILAEIDEDPVLVQSIKETDLFTINFSDKLGHTQIYCLDHYGFIKGNKVQLLNYNDTTSSKIDFFNHNAVVNGGVLDFNSNLISMPRNSGGHPSFNEPIFKKLKTMIDKADDSIFIDILLFGGTLGAALAEHLLDQTALKVKTNPNFKLFILHDFVNDYGMREEMTPIFDYMETRRKKDTLLNKSFYLLQSNIQKNAIGPKADHSKAMVVDANTDHPEAWVGSKNWSDHSGGYHFDNAVHIQGPAAALIQHSYYPDLKAALSRENKKYPSVAEEILDSFKVKKKKFPYVGSDTVRLTEMDVTGLIKNTRNMLIDMIQKAEHHIFMEQMFLYDPYVVDALIKRKIQNPQVDIKILTDHNGNFEMGGLPNSIFIHELKSYGINIRARKTSRVKAVFPDGSSRFYHQENHRKITSIDRKALLIGSGNLTPDTLQGLSREMGVQIFATDEIKRFEAIFLEDWSNPEKVLELDIENFQAILGGKKLSKNSSKLINGISASLLRAKDDIEGRD